MGVFKRMRDQLTEIAANLPDAANAPVQASPLATSVLARRSWRDGPTPGAVPLTVRLYDDRDPWVAVIDPATYEAIDLYEPDDQTRIGAVRFPVAGTGYRLREATDPAFFVGSAVRLEHDRRNRHDSMAIAVRSLDGRRTAGYVPRPKPPFRAQEIIHGFLRGGTLDAIVTDRSEEQGQQGKYLSMWVVAAPKLEIVDRPWPGDPDYKEFRQRTLQVEADRWHEERRRLRAAVRGPVIDRHFALQQLARRAYVLRDHHPEALEDAEAACREQIDLAAIVGPALRQQYGEMPSHHGFKQLSIMLEKKGQHKAALEIVEQALTQGWTGDWDTRRERLASRIGRQP